MWNPPITQPSTDATPHPRVMTGEWQISCFLELDNHCLLDGSRPKRPESETRTNKRTPPPNHQHYHHHQQQQQRRRRRRQQHHHYQHQHHQQQQQQRQDYNRKQCKTKQNVNGAADFSQVYITLINSLGTAINCRISTIKHISQTHHHHQHPTPHQFLNSAFWFFVRLFPFC